MSIARRLERRLEGLVDGMAGKLARGPLQPIELAGRLVREADLASTDTDVGPTVPNRFRVSVHPDELPDSGPPVAIVSAVAAAVAESFAERGWRADGPVTIQLRTDPRVGRGSLVCDTDIAPGPLPPWAELRGRAVYPIRHNRAVVGRAETADVVIPDERVSRRHALIWREGGEARVRDLGSSNGTTVDGAPVGTGSTPLNDGSVITVGGIAARFEIVERVGV